LPTSAAAIIVIVVIHTFLQQFINEKNIEKPSKISSPEIFLASDNRNKFKAID
jgi:C4-dicarboxylate transporter